MPTELIDKAIEWVQDGIGLLLDDSMTLPRHEGPLILIIGGSAMLAFSLFVSLLLQGRHWGSPVPASAGRPKAHYPHHVHVNGRKRSADRSSPHAPGSTTARSPRRGPFPAQAERTTLGPGGNAPRPLHSGTSRPFGTHGPRRVRRRMLRSLRKTGKRAGLGTIRHLVAPGGRHAVQLTRCRSCRDPRWDGSGCEWERRTLEAALRRHAPLGRVVEVECDRGRRGKCRFEIFPGGTRQ